MTSRMTPEVPDGHLTDRTRIAAAILSARWPNGDPVSILSSRTASYVADAVLAALSPRVVTTAEELDTLPPGAVVVTADGSAWQQGDGNPLTPGYWQPAEADTWPEDARETARRMSLPATVVWAPQQDPNPTPPGH